MKSLIDQDTLNWLFRLLIIGSAFIALFSVFDNTPFIVRAIGNLLIAGALMFLIDIDGGSIFKRLYFSVLAIWIVILVHSGTGFIDKSKDATEAFQTITFFIYAVSLVSIPLFTKAMQILSRSANEIDLEKDWRNLTRLSVTYYSIPFIAFFGTSIGRTIGAEVTLFYGITEGSNLPEDLVKYGVRALFFVPIVLVILEIRKTRDRVINVAP
jgi:hypothetical protein